MGQPHANGKGVIYVALCVPYEQAKFRIAAALTAGDQMVRDEFALA